VEASPADAVATTTDDLLAAIRRSEASIQVQLAEESSSSKAIGSQAEPLASMEFPAPGAAVEFVQRLGQLREQIILTAIGVTCCNSG
jgi:hypothetical protein